MEYSLRTVPLVSIDFIIKNKEGKILLGMRNNPPAKGYWFIPGGRVFKNEKLKKAIKRISKSEVGFKIINKDIILKGIYEHIYPNENYLGNSEFGTHYIAICCEYLLSRDIDLNKLPQDQHSLYKFMSIDELLKDKKVHIFTKKYFLDNSNNCFIKLF